MKAIGFCATIALLLLLTLTAAAQAETDKNYQISLRYAFTPGNLVFEKYSSLIVDAPTLSAHDSTLA